MAKNDLFINIPSYFRCPISMEVMKSPVSLSTGITYDRTSIQAWLDGGHTTCPATMQPLSSPSFVPNLTLHRLIHLQSLSSSHPSSLSLPHLLKRISDEKDLSISLKKILDRARKSEENRRVLANSDEFLASIGGLMTRFDPICDEFEILEPVVLILESIVSEFDEMREKMKIHNLIFNGESNSNSNCLGKFVSVLRNDKEESKIATARVLEKIAINSETKRSMIETPSLLNELYMLVCIDSNDAIESGLSAMIVIARSRSVKSELVKMGVVRIVTGILYDAGRGDPVVQRAMEMLELLCTCTDGRAAICDDERCVAEIVRRLMKVNEKTTKHGVTVVWSVCYMFRDERAKEVVVRSNGVAKCLVLLQSNCSAIVKQMCRDLVKALRVNAKSCLGTSYETKTTHIMPC